MTAVDIARARLRAQRLDPPIATAPAELVRWMGAVQAQEFGPSKWGLGLRLPETTTDSSIERSSARMRRRVGSASAWKSAASLRSRVTA